MEQPHARKGRTSSSKPKREQENLEGIWKMQPQGFSEYLILDGKSCRIAAM